MRIFQKAEEGGNSEAMGEEVKGVAKATEPLQDSGWWSGPGPLHTHFQASEVRKGTNDQQNPSPAGEFLLGRETGASFQSKQTHQRMLSLLLNLKYLENTEFLGLKLSSLKGYSRTKALHMVPKGQWKHLFIWARGAFHHAVPSLQSGMRPAAEGGPAPSEHIWRVRASPGSVSAGNAAAGQLPGRPSELLRAAPLPRAAHLTAPEQRGGRRRRGGARGARGAAGAGAPRPTRRSLVPRAPRAGLLGCFPNLLNMQPEVCCNLWAKA